MGEWSSGIGVIETKRYKYLHNGNDVQKGPLEPIDAHHIILPTTTPKGFILFFILLSATSSFSFLLKDNSIVVLFWSLVLSAFLVKLFFWKHVQKESVVIMPGFGVQLETQYGSGRTIHRFVPISKILKPVLNECVTPVTCYWSLSLIIRGEDELLLVFKEMMPPLKMLVPVWKALCAAANSKESLDAST